MRLWKSSRIQLQANGHRAQCLLTCLMRVVHIKPTSVHVCECLTQWRAKISKFMPLELFVASAATVPDTMPDSQLHQHRVKKQHCIISTMLPHYALCGLKHGTLATAPHVSRKAHNVKSYAYAEARNLAHGGTATSGAHSHRSRRKCYLTTQGARIWRLRVTSGARTHCKVRKSQRRALSCLARKRTEVRRYT